MLYPMKFCSKGLGHSVACDALLESSESEHQATRTVFSFQHPAYSIECTGWHVQDISPFVSAVVIFNMRSLNERDWDLLPYSSVWLEVIAVLSLPSLVIVFSLSISLSPHPSFLLLFFLCSELTFSRVPSNRLGERLPYREHNAASVLEGAYASEDLV